MPKLRVPLLRKIIWATGDVLLRAELDLLLRDGNGLSLPALKFRVDTGSEMSTMPAALAKRLGLPIPKSPNGTIVIGNSPTEVRSGIIRAQIVSLNPTEYEFPYYFLGDPAAPSNPGPLPALAINVLGLSGVVDKVRFLFDGTPTSFALHGILEVETY